jgi:hypothetical protein
VVTIVETQPTPMPTDTRKVEQLVAPEMPVVNQHGLADHTQHSRPESTFQPVTHFGLDDFRHNRVSLVGSFTKSDRDQPVASATDGNQRPPERATYAELMREYVPRSNELQPGTLSPPPSADTGDRT